MGYVYPATPPPASGYTLGDGYATLISGPYQTGRVVAQAGRQYPLFRASLTYGPWLTEADLQGIIGLHRNCRGRATSFAFFEFVSASWTKLYVNVGDAVTDTFDLPFKLGTSITYYVAGTGTAGTYSEGTGTDRRSTVEFASAPAAGALIEVTFTGYRCVQCRFTSDDLPFNRLSGGRAEMTVEIEETR